MTLRLVQPGDELPVDEAQAELQLRADQACEAIQAAVKAGGEFWALTTGEDMHVTYAGDALEMACIAEEVARRIRLAEIGFD